MKWLRDNSLSVALFGLFAVSVIGHALTGVVVWNEELARGGARQLTFAQYLMSGQFGSTLFENWESEFLQMGVFVMLTAYLFQRGSAESNDPDEKEEPSKDDRAGPQSPWPVRVGGLARTVYAHSLGLALFLLFFASFVLHFFQSARYAADEARLHGEPAGSLLHHLGGAEFWFESFQNWQSEFFSTAILIVLAIYLRQRGSPESKAVGAPHSQTGAG